MSNLPPNFWAKVTQSECVVWTGAVNGKGYPCFAVNGVSQLAHRLAWEDAHGPIPEGMTVDHTCRVRNCVRVDHLEVVSVAENNRRARVSADLVLGGKCGSGHPLTEDSTYRHPRGQLVCRECSRQQVSEFRSREALDRGEVPAADIREWAMRSGIPVSQRGRLSPKVRNAYIEAHSPERAAS